MNQTFLTYWKNKHKEFSNSVVLDQENLVFNGINLKKLIVKHGSPLKVFHLPKIRSKIHGANLLFNNAIESNNYKGSYTYCYCTKSAHYASILRTTLKAGASLETSSELDIDLILALQDEDQINPSTHIIHNGFKSKSHLQKIMTLQQSGFTNSIIVLDSIQEFRRLKECNEGNFEINLGIRLATNQSSKSQISRHGIPKNELIDFCLNELKSHDTYNLTMLHFFVDEGMSDSLAYWDQLDSALDTFAQLKPNFRKLSNLNIGGGLPINSKENNSGIDQQIIKKLVKIIKQQFDKFNLEEPNLFTEFGNYTVAESGINLFTIAETKKQGNDDLWYLLDGSLVNSIPDAWIEYSDFEIVPINKWQNPVLSVKLGGISCDHTDSLKNGDAIMLPANSSDDPEPLQIAFLNTGAYQDAYKWSFELQKHFRVYIMILEIEKSHRN